MGRYLRPSEALTYKPDQFLYKRGLKRPQLVTIYLTEGAWNRHMHDAIQLQYVKAYAANAKGIVLYFQALTTPGQRWSDERPTYLRDLSAMLLDPQHDPRRRNTTDAEGLATYTFNAGLPTARLPLNAGPHHPIWWDPETDSPGGRMRRVFKLDQFPLEYYAQLALTHSIGDPYHRNFQLTRTLLASNALEAIGRNTLQPAIKLGNPHPITTRLRRRPKEIEW